MSRQWQPQSDVLHSWPAGQAPLHMGAVCPHATSTAILSTLTIISPGEAFMIVSMSVVFNSVKVRLHGVQDEFRTVKGRPGLVGVSGGWFPILTVIVPVLNVPRSNETT